MGADGVRVTEPDAIRESVEWAIAESDRRQLPVLVEIMTSREESAAMGAAIDAIREPDDIAVVSLGGQAARPDL
jgi:tartronate-semialdehyde synthase